MWFSEVGYICLHKNHCLFQSVWWCTILLEREILPASRHRIFNPLTQILHWLVDSNLCQTSLCQQHDSTVNGSEFLSAESFCVFLLWNTPYMWLNGINTRDVFCSNVYLRFVMNSLPISELHVYNIYYVSLLQWHCLLSFSIPFSPIRPEQEVMEISRFCIKCVMASPFSGRKVSWA